MNYLLPWLTEWIYSLLRKSIESKDCTESKNWAFKYWAEMFVKYLCQDVESSVRCELSIWKMIPTEDKSWDKNIPEALLSYQARWANFNKSWGKGNIERYHIFSNME